MAKVECYGIDVIFEDIQGDGKEEGGVKGWIVDLNYMPSYKSIKNFRAVLWHYVLWKYRDFIDEKRRKS